MANSDDIIDKPLPDDAPNSSRSSRLIALNGLPDEVRRFMTANFNSCILSGIDNTGEPYEWIFARSTGARWALLYSLERTLKAQKHPANVNISNATVKSSDDDDDTMGGVETD